MKKGNMELGKKIITWAMVAVMTVTSVGGSFGTMTVYAEETVVENEDGSVTKTETSTDTTTNEDGSTTTETTTTTTTTTSTDETSKVTVSEIETNGGTEYYVDGTKVEEAQGEQDYIVEELVVDEAATKVNHYIVDADGNYVTDENGNNIEVSNGTVIEQIEVVEKIDGTSEDVNEEDIVFVKENEDGVKELVDAATEGATEYVEVENADDYADSVTINELTVTDAERNVTKLFVDDDLAKLLDDDDTTESENYTLETVYTVSVKDEDGKDTTVEVKASELGENEAPETDAEGNVKFSVTENTTYSFTDKNGNTCAAAGASVTVTKEKNRYYATVTDENGNETKVEVNKNSVQSSGPNWNKKYSISTTSKTTYETTLGGITYEVDSKNVKTETHYEVINENGETVMELTKEQYENRNVDSKDYAKVEDEYVVYKENEAGEKVEAARFTEDEWEVITEAEVTYKRVTKMYYTADANVEYTEASFGEKGSELKLGDTYYKLDVKLFKNTDGITYGAPACTIDEATKEAVVSVTYTLKDGTTGTLTRRVALADFGKSNYATVTIKYVPTYTTKEGFDFTVKVVKNTENSVVVETVKTTTTGKEEVEQEIGTTVDTAIIANDGEPVNDKGDNKKKANHVDVRVNVNLSEELKNKGVSGAAVAEAIIKIDRNGKQYPLGKDDIRRDGFAYEFNLDKHSLGNGNDGFQGNQTITIYAKITYKLDGKEKELWYATTVYPEVYDDLNVCPAKYWNDNTNPGFDFIISVDTINDAIEKQITTTTTETHKSDSLKMTLGMETSLTPDEVAEVIGASVNEGIDNVDENLIKALMFVRLDGVEMKENGKTHYPASEYSKELAKGQVILLFTPEGYEVHGEIGEDTVYGNILTFVEDETEKFIPEIEKAYLENLTDEQKELIRNAVELEVEKQIEEQKKAKAESLFGEEYTEEQLATITWTIDQDAIDAAIEDVMANLAVRWYVLKEEADGAHIDGVIVTKSFDIKVNGEVITIPEIIPDEPAPVPPTDEGSDGGSTGGGSSSRSSRSSSDEGAVLGAKREQEGLVPEEGQVLGAVRAPKTSDASKAILWMLVMGGSALGAAAVLAQKKKEEA